MFKWIIVICAGKMAGYFDALGKFWWVPFSVSAPFLFV